MADSLPRVIDDVAHLLKQYKRIILDHRVEWIVFVFELPSHFTCSKYSTFHHHVGLKITKLTCLNF